MRGALAAILLLLLVGVAQAGDRAFSGVNVITLDGQHVQADQVVVVRNGVIDQVGPRDSTRLPDDVTVVAASGQYLMPGLGEMHAHIPSSRDRERMEEVLFLYLSQGITTVRGMLGEPGHLEARERQRRGELAAPRILAGGPSLNGRSVGSPEEGVEMVMAQHEAGYDHLKIHPGLSREAFDAIAERARELGMKFVGHVSAEYGALHAIDQGQTGIDHMDGFIAALVPAIDSRQRSASGFFGINLTDAASPEAIPELAARVAGAGTWVVPTETLMVNLAGPHSAAELLAGPGMRYVSESMLEGWQQAHRDFRSDDFDADRAARWLELRRQLIGALHRAGANLMLGSDAPQIFNVPGFSLHRELALYVEAGLSPADVLATGSTAVARYQGLEERRGRILPGHDADLVLLEQNPLSAIEHSRSIVGVMVAGRWYDRAELDRRLEEIAAKYAPQRELKYTPKD